MVAHGLKANHLLLDWISTRKRMKMASSFTPFFSCFAKVLFCISEQLWTSLCILCEREGQPWTPLVLVWLLPEMGEGEVAWPYPSWERGVGKLTHTLVPREEDRDSEMKPCVKVR